MDGGNPFQDRSFVLVGQAIGTKDRVLDRIELPHWEGVQIDPEERKDRMVAHIRTLRSLLLRIVVGEGDLGALEVKGFQEAIETITGERAPRWNLGHPWCPIRKGK